MRGAVRSSVSLRFFRRGSDIAVFFLDVNRQPGQDSGDGDAAALDDSSKTAQEIENVDIAAAGNIKLCARL